MVGVTGTAAAAASGALSAAAWSTLRAEGPATVDEVATLLGSSGSTVLVVAWAVRVCCALLTHLPGAAGRHADQAARRVATPGARRVAALLLGATVTSALPVSTASAVERHARDFRGPAVSAPATAGALRTVHPQPGFLASVAERLVTAEPPGWTPTRPVVRPQPAPSLVTSGRGERRPGEVVVHRGDSLWDIAARHLGPGATDAEVADAWPAWHEANRTVIGDDPHRILPGQLLRVPGAVRP